MRLKNEQEKTGKVAEEEDEDEEDEELEALKREVLTLLINCNLILGGTSASNGKS